MPGRWSVLKVVCHLADADANIAHRIKRILSEDRPAFDRVQPDLMQALSSLGGTRGVVERCCQG
jgi:hypothetical protein